MFSATLKRRLLVAHLWLALWLAPIFFLIHLSGAVFALKPILYPGGTAAGSFAPTSGRDVVAALDAIDPAGKASTVNLSTDGRSIILTTMKERVSDTPEHERFCAGDDEDRSIALLASQSRCLT